MAVLSGVSFLLFSSQEKLVRVQVLHTIHKALFLTVEKEH